MTQLIDPHSTKEIGHDARKPLVSLINIADLLLAGLEGELSDQVQLDIEAMRENAASALIKLDYLLALLVEALQ